VTATDAPPRRTQGLSVTADGRVVPSARRRFAGLFGHPLLTRLDSRAGGWAVTVGITVLAGFLRLWNLGTPRDFLFDETYYAKDAWSLWRLGYAQTWVDDANEAIVEGRWSPKLQTGDPEMVVHPEVGKWLIGAGEHVFGFDALGWRLAPAIVGTLMVLVMVRLVRRLTGSTLLGGVAGLLLCFDGMQLTLSRLALLDIFCAFFLLSAVSCLVADRDWGRARIAAVLDTGVRYAAADWGPVRGLRWRPWRLAAGVLFGLAIGSKWTALIPLAGFGLLVLVWDTGARRALGIRNPLLKTALADGVLAFCYLVLVAGVVYVGTWAGWLVHHHVYEVHLARNNYGPYWGSYTENDPQGFFPGLVQGLRSLWHYHTDVWTFHSSGLVGAKHAYQSDPRTWLLQYRPVNTYSDLGIQPGTQGCTAPADSTCLRQVIILGTPVLWWAGCLALLHTAYNWLARRDWRSGLVLVGVVTTWVPFFRYADRPIFSFYAVTTLPFVIVAICLVLGRLIGPPEASPRRRLAGTVLGGTFVVLVVLHFAWLWPVYTGQLITTPEWLHRIWFRSWI
jgi:dolichyl-phosphate-mannose-protein mannosyltransferase